MEVDVNEESVESANNCTNPVPLLPRTKHEELWSRISCSALVSSKGCAASWSAIMSSKMTLMI